MISFENTLPVKIESTKYNDFELMKNDVSDLELKDSYGMPSSDPILFFRGIVEQMIDMTKLHSKIAMQRKERD